jgi:hypothetical protein
MPRLDDLAREYPIDDTPRVPAWTLGCFHRRSIVYATGADDTLTKVVWVQSHTMTGDLRIPPGRPRIAADDRPEDMDHATLTRLAAAEGSTGETCWQDGMMSWNWGPSVQPYDKWAEPALLRRVGASLIEFAPSGIYVEDWRHQPSAAGPIGALRLLGEKGTDGHVTPLSGHIVFAGDHAIQCIDARAAPLPSQRAQDIVAAAADPLAAWQWVSACATDYAICGAIVSSTDPWREGEPLGLDQFVRDGERALRQTFVRDGRPIHRLWQIVSLGWAAAFSIATEAEPARLKWLECESDTLLAAHRTAACAS